MGQYVDFFPRGYNRKELDTVVDRTFKEFGKVEQKASVPTVEQFFNDYEDLFYSIPVTGSVNSHQYLIEKSSQLCSMEDPLVDLEPLLEEITLLKSQSVQYQQTILELQQQIGELNAANNQI